MGEHYEIRKGILGIAEKSYSNLKVGLDRTHHFTTLPGRAGHLKFPGHVLPDRTNTGPPFLVKLSVGE